MMAQPLGDGAPPPVGVEPHTATPYVTHEAAEGADHHEGGLPQFDLQWWPGQIAWLLIVFVVVLAFMRLFAVPRLGGAIEAREQKIASDIAEARRVKEEADAQAEAARVEAAQARAAAQKLVLEAKAKAQGEIAASLAAEEAKLAEAGAAAEARIGQARDAAMSHVQEIAADAAQAIVTKLTGRAPSAAELTAARG